MERFSDSARSVNGWPWCLQWEKWANQVKREIHPFREWRRRRTLGESDDPRGSGQAVTMHWAWSRRDPIVLLIDGFRYSLVDQTWWKQSGETWRADFRPSRDRRERLSHCSQRRNRDDRRRREADPDRCSGEATCAVDVYNRRNQRGVNRPSCHSSTEHWSPRRCASRDTEIVPRCSSMFSDNERASFYRNSPDQRSQHGESPVHWMYENRKHSPCTITSESCIQTNQIKSSVFEKSKKKVHCSLNILFVTDYEQYRFQTTPHSSTADVDQPKSLVDLTGLSADRLEEYDESRDTTSEKKVDFQPTIER